MLTTTVRVIRDAYGAKKTGNQNRREISKALRDLGVGHFPAEFPTYQHEAVRLYCLGSPVADVIEAVLTPEPKTDGLLRQAAGGKAAEILGQIQGVLAGWS